MFFGLWLGCALLSKFSLVRCSLCSLHSREHAVATCPTSASDKAGSSRVATHALSRHMEGNRTCRRARLHRLLRVFVEPIPRRSLSPGQVFPDDAAQAPANAAWLYVRGMAVIAFSFVRPMFILGHGYPHGKWFYFPVLLALKLTLGSIVIAATALLLAVARHWNAQLESAIPAGRTVHWRVLWIAVMVFLGIHMFSMFDVSLRHLSVPHVLFFLMLAPLPRMISQLRSRKRWIAMAVTAIVTVAAASSLYTAVHTYPYYMPYFNSFATGRPTYYLASDSNVDWNQALPDVKAFLEQQGQHRVSIDTYAFSDPAAFVPNAEMWDCQTDRGRRWPVGRCVVEHGSRRPQLRMAPAVSACRNRRRQHVRFPSACTDSECG